MLRLRLKRYGKKHNPIYNLGIMKSTTKRNGLTIKNIGFYNPKTKDLKFEIESIIQGLNCGVQPTVRVLFLLKKIKIIL